MGVSNTTPTPSYCPALVHKTDWESPPWDRPEPRKIGGGGARKPAERKRSMRLQKKKIIRKSPREIERKKEK
jgi:hypothetical protein